MTIFTRFAAPTFLVLICAGIAGAADPAPDIVTIDIAQILNESNLTINRHEASSLRADVMAFNAAMKRYDEELARLKGESELYDKGDDKYLDLMHALKVKETEAKLYSQRTQARLDHAQVVLYRTCFDDIQVMLSEFAKKKGYDMVLLSSPRKGAAQTMREFSMELASIAVLYRNDARDITSDFLAYVNAAHPLAKNATTVPAQPPAKPPTKPTFDLGGDQEP